MNETLRAPVNTTRIRRWLAWFLDPHRSHVDDPLYGYEATEDICDKCWDADHLVGEVKG